MRNRRRHHMKKFKNAFVRLTVASHALNFRILLLPLVWDFFHIHNFVKKKSQDFQMTQVSATLTNTFLVGVEWLLACGCSSPLCQFERDMSELQLAFFQAVIKNADAFHLVALIPSRPLLGFRPFLCHSGTRWHYLERCAWKCNMSWTWRSTHPF